MAKQPGKKTRSTAEQAAVKRAQFFHKHVVEQKTVVQCAKEMQMSRRQLTEYKNADDYRQMAITFIDESPLKGLQGATNKLMDALESTRAIVTENGDGSQTLHRVPDMKTQLEALKEVHKIYGVYAAERRDTEITISLSSDAELFAQIDSAQRNCRVVESIEARQGCDELASDQHQAGAGTFKSRKRALLHDGPLPEPQ